jgi:hypothetical protein
MKKMMLISLIIAFPFNYVAAQTAGGESKSYKKMIAGKRVKSVKKVAANKSVTFTSTAANEAYSRDSKLLIADPTIKAFNKRAAGADIRLSSSGVAGMPKGTYGFARGKILLRSTTASSPGTSYGSGAVGTGTSINSIGTSEATIGVNGKSPQAGPWLWGSKQPAYNLPYKKDTTGNWQ